jgi:hypothetical protein
MACITNKISQPSLEISPIWIPLLREEVGRLQGSSLNPGLLDKVLCRGLVPALSNFIDSYRSVITPLSSVVAVVLSLFVFYIDTADFSFHFYLYFTFYVSDKYN